ncbi:LLM class flavin-dependent oxidoreductase [bacterium]|nr:LLM class flavin-dependent oxidoreductase [bacterium]
MEFGVQISSAGLAEMKALATQAEALGFGVLMLADHIVYEGPEKQIDTSWPSYDAMVRAALLLEATSRVRVGHLVLCNLFRHPAITAQGILTLDHLSGGRAFCGIGTGWTATEFAMTGIPYPDMPTRLEMLDEALTVMKMLWSQERTTFTGRHYQLRDAILSPKPARQPEILLGGGGKGLLRVAAKHADVVNIIAAVGANGYISTAEAAKLTDESFRARVRFLREEAARHGRDGDAIRISNVAFTTMLTDSAEQTRNACEALAGFFRIPADAVPRAPLALVGTPDAVAAEIARRERDWGVSQIVFSAREPGLIERLAKDVLPLVR